MKTYVIESNGKHYVDDQKDVSLEYLQGKVNGYIESISLPNNLTMMVNEDGFIFSLSANIIASKLYGSYILGNAVIVKYNEDGESVTLSDDDIKYIEDSINEQ